MKIKDMLGINGARLVFGHLEDTVDFNFFSKDTRTIKENDVFIGIKGDNFDGSDFGIEAFLKGAHTCILEKEIEIDKEQFKDRNLIVVNNTKDFLVELARPIRDKIKVPIIAVTGSVGKTSTKNIIADVLATKYKVLKTKGNLNTLAGMALTLLSLKDEEIIVIEMGMNQAGEISKLTNFLRPSVAVITNVGTAHIGNLGSRENILKAKLEILEGLQGPLFINNDNDLLNSWHKNTQINNKIITYGIDEISDYRATSISYDKLGSHFQINNELIDINVLGKHFIYNAVVGFALGSLFAVPFAKMKEKFNHLLLEHDRMELINKDNITIINDSYNASYDSVFYALEVLSFFPSRKIAVLGDIKELGDYSKEIHQKIGDLIVKFKIDILVTVGENAKFINERALELGFKSENAISFNSNLQAAKYIKKLEKSEDVILIKASNSFKFKEIVDFLREE